ncbi:MAG TPA: hypothetical protein DCS93_22685 [Microscillaceae bacterium]|nr:hypothetical protein [Microscillaceae bacterium]
MKNLTKNAVKEAAEHLIEAFGTTTTLDVKNRLRQQGFQALQAEVSNLMDTLTDEEQWRFNHNGRYRVYRFGPDSNDTFHKYLEQGQRFWEILASGKEQIINEGLIGTIGQMTTTKYPTNRKTIAQSKKVHQTMLDQGYSEAVDQRLPFNLRQKYATYLDQKPLKYTIGFFNVQAQERLAAEITLENNQKTNGYILQSKNAGYDLTWNLPQSQDKLTRVLKNPSTITQDPGYDQKQLTGEKISVSRVFNQQEKVIQTFQGFTPTSLPSLQVMELHLENIYKIDIWFESGSQISLSKFDLDIHQELLPVARQILMQAG